MEPAIRGHVGRDALLVLDRLLEEEPAILLEGPRGSGKSTLAREIAAARDARVVDRSRQSARFLLAGSVSSRPLPTGAETLTGRVHRMLLPPLSTAEIAAGDTGCCQRFSTMTIPSLSLQVGAARTTSNF